MVGLMVFIPVWVVFSMFYRNIGGVLASYSSVQHVTPSDFEYGPQHFTEFYIWYSIIKSVVYAFIISPSPPILDTMSKAAHWKRAKPVINAVVKRAVS